MSDDEPIDETSDPQVEEEEEDDVVKAIKAEKNKPRDHPPSITCDDFIVDISFHPSKNLIAIANIVGDVLLYEYNNEETKLLNTLELHLKACRDVEFDEEGHTLYSTAKVSIILFLNFMFISQILEKNKSLFYINIYLFDKMSEQIKYY